MRILLSVLLIGLTFSSVSFAGKAGSKESSVAAAKTLESLINKQLLKLSKKWKAFYDKNEIHSAAKEKTAFLQTLAAIVAETDHISFCLSSDYEAVYQAFELAATAIDPSSAFATRETVHNYCLKEIDAIRTAAQKAADKAIEKGASSEEAAKIRNQVALLNLLKLIVKNADAIFLDTYTNSLYYLSIDFSNNPFESELAWFQFRNRFFASVPHVANGFLSWIEVFETSVDDMLDQGSTFLAGHTDPASTLQVLPLEVMHLIAMSLVATASWH